MNVNADFHPRLTSFPATKSLMLDDMLGEHAVIAKQSYVTIQQILESFCSSGLGGRQCTCESKYCSVLPVVLDLSLALLPEAFNSPHIPPAINHVSNSYDQWSLACSTCAITHRGLWTATALHSEALRSQNSVSPSLCRHMLSIFLLHWAFPVVQRDPTPSSEDRLLKPLLCLCVSVFCRLLSHLLSRAAHLAPRLVLGALSTAAEQDWDIQLGGWLRRFVTAAAPGLAAMSPSQWTAASRALTMMDTALGAQFASHPPVQEQEGIQSNQRQQRTEQQLSPRAPQQSVQEQSWIYQS